METGCSLNIEQQKRSCYLCFLSLPETEVHVHLECPAYEDISHDFQEFLQGCSFLQEFLTRMEPSLTALGMLFAHLLNKKPNSWKFQTVKLGNKLRFSFQLLV